MKRFNNCGTANRKRRARPAEPGQVQKYENLRESPTCAPTCVTGGGERTYLRGTHHGEVTRTPHDHTYGPHLHVRRRKPEANRFLHFYSALSFFLSPSRPTNAFGSAREPVNERAHNRLPLPAALSLFSSSAPPPPPSLETVFHIQNVFPARRGFLPDSRTPCSSANPRAARLLSQRPGVSLEGI